MLLDLLYLLSVLIIIYVFFGYLIILMLADLIIRKKIEPIKDIIMKKVLVVVTVHNEEKNIKNRLKNIFESDYPLDLLNVLIISDGSTDQTENIIRSSKFYNIELLSLEQQLGKSVAQNNLKNFIKDNEIIVFTDAESLFDKNCLKEIVKSFSNPKVGAVGAKLIFQSNSNDGISSSQDLYWNYELKLRSYETSLGILTSMSGACMSVRFDLFSELPSDVGEDCFIPLYVANMGYKVIQNDKALAYDKMKHTSLGELKTRIRMTKRNLKGTLMFHSLINPFKSFKYSFAIFSHKLLRWLSPLFLIFLSIAPFVFTGSFIFSLMPFKILIILIYICGLLGFLFNIYGFKVFFFSQVYSFILANIGFLLGITYFIFKSKKQTIY